MSILSAPHFHNEEAAYEFVEARVWPNGPLCPHCGEAERVGKLKGKSTRIGVYKCYSCRKPFTVKIGTIFEASHIPLRKWLQAIFLFAASKKGISANQLHRTLGVTLKTAWFMGHRIREAMRSGDLGPMGGKGKVVEVDETFIGKSKDKPKGARAYHHKQKVLTLVERGGRTRSFPIASASIEAIMPILTREIDRESRIMTDEARYYSNVKLAFAGHDSVNHSAGEYGRGEIHTNTIEGFFSIFKRGMKGVYQHCAERHLPRYLAEFDFRYNERAAKGVDDETRAEKLLCGIIGKRLTYETANPQVNG